MRQRRKTRPDFDPVRDWDGLMRGYTRSGRALTADEVTHVTQIRLQQKERSLQVCLEDEEAKAPPIGGMQYRAKR